MCLPYSKCVNFVDKHVCWWSYLGWQQMLRSQWSKTNCPSSCYRPIHYAHKCWAQEFRYGVVGGLVLMAYVQNLSEQDRIHLGWCEHLGMQLRGQSFTHIFDKWTVMPWSLVSTGSLNNLLHMVTLKDLAFSHGNRWVLNEILHDH